MSLRTFLTRLILSCVLPLVLLAAYLAADNVSALKKQYELQAQTLTRNVTIALDRQVESLVSGLQVLADSSSAGDPARLGELYHEAQLFHRTFDSHVLFSDLSKQMILNTRVPFGMPLPHLPAFRGRSAFSAVMATGKPAASDLFFGPIAMTPLVSIAVPVVRNGRITHVLLCLTEASKFQHRLDELVIPADWTVSVVDGNNALIARRSPKGEHLKQAQGALGRFRAVSTLAPWTVVVEVPEKTYGAPMHGAVLAMFAVIAAATFVSLTGALLAGRRLARSVEALAQAPQPAETGAPITEIEKVRGMLLSAAAAREEAEATLRESEERLRLLGDNLPESYVYQYLHEADGRTRFVYLSAGLERVHGVTREAVLADALALHRQIDPEQLPELARQEKASGDALSDFKMELRMRRADGEWRWLQLRSRPRQRSDGVVVWDGVATDITEPKLVEARVEHLNRVLRAVRMVDQLIVREQDPLRLIEGVCQLLVEHRGYGSALILLTDRAGGILQVAQSGAGDPFPGMSEMLSQGGIPPCCRKEDGPSGVFSLTEGGHVCAGCPLSKGLREHRTMCIVMRYEQDLHGLMVVSLNGQEGVDNEETELFAGLAGDVAFAIHNIEQGRERVRMQDERDRFETELRQAQKMEAIGQLAGGIAHDFNNMLSVIVGFTQLAMVDLDAEDPQYRNLEQVRKAGERSAELTRQLLAFSRKQAAAPRVVDLNELIAEQRKMLSRLIGEDLEVEFQAAEELWNIRIDPSQAHQILTNLAVNARDAVQGVGKVTIATANVSLDPDESMHLQLAPGEYVLLAFSDTGTGMDLQTQERIFEPFFTTKKEGKGTGLGLSTVYGIVRQNAGAIQVESAPGAGTTFRIYFPRTVEEAAKGQENSHETQAAGTETVLVVEDEEQVLNLTRVMLEQAGYHVLPARGGADALAMCKSYQGEIHLLLTDVVMPMLNGKELQDQVLGARPGVKTLFMSGYGEEIISHRGILDRGTALLSKPFSGDQLLRKVREVLDAQ
ncbi:response regulator [Geomonas terrae]|uniref:histidine kinase n=1 Tax=Geomonas terrae TaxID=2562681 RepID=A0A4S1CB37_9BACT|nr:ATP-binding protein [Geomonas terrae]TGU70527.1 response regulator [Geomonas terrae]TGU72947.1 response regulator [Geomonas terrae]